MTLEEIHVANLEEVRSSDPQKALDMALIREVFPPENRQQSGMVSDRLEAIDRRLENMKALITQGANVNSSLYFDRPLLVGAAQIISGGYGQVEKAETKILDTLIDNATPADLNTLNSDGQSALTWTITNGNNTSSELLLAKGADVNYESWNDKPIHAAASSRESSEEVFKKVLQKTENLEMPGLWGRTPESRALPHSLKGFERERLTRKFEGLKGNPEIIKQAAEARAKTAQTSKKPAKGKGPKP